MAKINKNEDILFHNFQDSSLDDHYKKADIFIKPTIKDHYGFYFVKPMQYGLPVITTDFFAIPEVVENGKEGLLIDIMDYNYVLNEKKGQLLLSNSLKKYLEDEIYYKLKMLIENKNLRTEMGRNARKKAITKFSYRANNPAMKRIYEEAVKK
jgi:glycosyltransferase involved in cell wall biosynthesis